MSITSNRINTNDVDAVVSYWLFDCIDKGRCSQSARSEFHPRFVRHFATHLVDNFYLPVLLTRVAVRNPQGVNFIHASCDILLLALSIIFALVGKNYSHSIVAGGFEEMS